MRQGMTESIIVFTFGILTLVIMALPFRYWPYDNISLSGYDLLQGDYARPGLWLDVAAGAVVAFLGFIALLSSLGGDWRSKASILGVLDESMLVGGALVVYGFFLAAIQVEVYVGQISEERARVIASYPVFGFWALLGLGFLMIIVGSRLMKMERQRGAGGLVGGLNQTGVISQLLMAATSAVLFMGMLLFLYIRTDLALYINLVGSIILIVTCCLSVAATSKSPLGVNASAIGIASGVMNMFFLD